MQTLTWGEGFMGLAVLLAVIGMLIVVLVQHRTILTQHGGTADLALALTEALKEANANTKALDLLEPLATKVVPASLVRQFNAGASFVETLTPDQWDAFIEQVRSFVNRSTDGLPNNDLAQPAG